MDTTTIIIAVVALLVGAIIAYFLLPKNQENRQENSNQENALYEEMKKEVEALKHNLVEKEELLKNALANTEAVEKEKIKLNESIANYEQMLTQNAGGENQALLQELDRLKTEIKTYEEQANQNDTKVLEQEIETLKKNIQEYEDRLDDAEFDLEKMEKKYKETSQNLTNLTKNFEELERENNVSKKELEDKTQKLDEVQNNLDKKDEAVELVNSLLSAPFVDSEKTNDGKAVSDIQSFVEDRLLVALRGYNEITDDELKKYRNDIWNWANLQRKQWIAGKKTVAFVGEFSAGKTSIVNRILVQDNPNARLLPVSSKATTAIPTYISYLASEKVEFTTPNGDLKKVDKSVLKKITKETLEEIKVSSMIQYFINSYENENLKGLSILDTPGFNSNDDEDRKRTSEVIKETDVLFWVMDANAGEINKSSLKIIKEELQGHPLFIIINKADTKSKPEIDALQKHIQNTMDREGIIVNGYIEFSQKHSIDELMSLIHSVPNNPNKSDYLAGIYDKLIEEIAEADGDYKAFQKGVNKLSDAIYSVENGIKSVIRNINDLGGNIQNLPSEKKEWFGLGDTYYKMTESQYSVMSCNINGIGDNVEKIRKSTEALKKNVENLQKEEVKSKEAQRQRDNLETLKEDFDRLIKKWDKNYLGKAKEKGKSKKNTTTKSNSNMMNTPVESMSKDEIIRELIDKYGYTSRKALLDISLDFLQKMLYNEKNK